jgi:hypothetical protein
MALGTVWASGTFADTGTWAAGAWADVPAVVATPYAGKYAPEHAGARVDLGAATGFAPEWAGALGDLRGAGR